MFKQKERKKTQYSILRERHYDSMYRLDAKKRNLRN